MPNPNVIVFGETGTGKSSLVNMLSGADVAVVSSAAKGCTFESKKYVVTIRGQQYNLWDTAGFNEGDTIATVTNKQAIAQVYGLLRGLSDGVNLLIFVLRGPRLKEASMKNWRVFKEIICNNKVPAAIVVTGLENEEVMDEWWFRNRGPFDQLEVHPAGQACITTIKGKRRADHYAYQHEYDESKNKMENLLRYTSLSLAWKVERIQWVRTIITTTYESKGWCKDPEEKKHFHKEYTEAVEQLVERCDLSRKEAGELADALEQVN